VFSWQVQLFDTDAYGVMWHGAYAKWLEYARHHWLQAQGYTLPVTSQASVYFPVVEQHLHFKQPARQNDRLCCLTTLTLALPRLVFEQQVYRLSSPAEGLTAEPSSPLLSGYNQTLPVGATLLLKADTTCLLTTASLRPLRHLPVELAFLAKAAANQSTEPP
jgi:YbgC/YbaW family acyl-CoA thioester hydrolase